MNEVDKHCHIMWKEAGFTRKSASISDKIPTQSAQTMLHKRNQNGIVMHSPTMPSLQKLNFEYT